MTSVSLKNISKSYGKGKKQLEVIKNLDLEIFSKEFLALVGPSGCGKSTLLRMI
ncbi:MAG: ATP-binding cassette domain-containing protein, partial [Emcibacteraceae bacterium]|nr:ATP-binding cassette domain-containing protein [Emcibacteraceae bacterium]